jgi:flagellar hook-length control protein FliK
MPATPVFAPPAPPAESRQANPLEAAIARQVSSAAVRQGLHGAPMVVRITPPELGTVRIELHQREGRVEARLSAEDEGVRQALDKMLPQLRADLSRADGRISEVSVAPSQERGGGQQGSGDPAGDGRAWAERQAADRQEQARDGGGRNRGFSLSGGEAATEAPSLSRSRPAAVRSHQGAVDLLA